MNSTNYYRYFWLAVIFFSTQALSGQAGFFTPPFVLHLNHYDLRTEQEMYFQQFAGSNNDTVNYYEAKFHLKYFNDSLFLQNLKKDHSLIHHDSCLYQLAGFRFLQTSDLMAQQWFKQEKTDINVQQTIAYHIYMSSVDPINYPYNDLDNSLKDDFKRYKKIYGKKPWKAGLASAIFPGLGKLYLGRKKSFLAALLTTTILTIQNTESISKKGPGNVVSIINLSLAGSFYLSNIVGAIYETNKRKKELRKEYLINAATYYENNCHCSLY